MTKRKPHSDDAGYIAERIFLPSGSHIVIYDAKEQGIDVGGCRYAVVCSKHSTLVGDSSLARARMSMKNPRNFCAECAPAA